MEITKTYWIRDIFYFLSVMKSTRTNNYTSLTIKAQDDSEGETIDALFDLSSGGRVELVRLYDGCLHNEDFERTKKLLDGFELKYSGTERIINAKYEGDLAVMTYPEEKEYIKKLTKKSYFFAHKIRRELRSNKANERSHDATNFIMPALDRTLRYYANNFERQWSGRRRRS